MIIGGLRMKFKKGLIILLLSASVILSFCACSAQTASGLPQGGPESVLNVKSPDGYSWKLSSDGTYWYVTDLCYVESPVDSAYQTMSIFVPAEYMKHGLSRKIVFTHKKVNGFTEKTAPILFDCGSTDYSENKSSVSADAQAIKDGFIYVSVGHRGKGTTAIGTDGKTYYDGKSPWGLIDLKSAIRYLRFNDEALPGSADRIVTTDGGGDAMSALLACSANDPVYDKYLKTEGAITSVGDEVYASNCLSPAINLANADSAYEWMLGTAPLPGDKDLSAFQTKLSEYLSKEFADYLSDSGYSEADFSETLNKQLEVSVNDFFGEVLGGNMTVSWTDDAMFADAKKPTLKEIADNFINGYYVRNGEKGENASSWLAWDEGKQTAVISSLSTFEDYCGRAKSVTAFDELDGKAEGNQVFGAKDEDFRHYSNVVLNVLADNYTELEKLWTDKDTANTGYASFSSLYAAYKADVSNDDIDENGNNIVDLYNPMLFIDGNTHYLNGDTAKHVRIRMGTGDTDSALPIVSLFGLTLEKAGISVDMAYFWGSKQDYSELESKDLYAWITQICAE